MISNCFPKGFTLIELLVVVLIIGLLAAIAIPQYQKVVKKSQGTEALTVIDALDKALSSYYLENSTYDGIDPNTFSVTIPEMKHWQFAMGSTGTSWQESPSIDSVHLHVGSPVQDLSIFLINQDRVGLYGHWLKGKLTSFFCAAPGGTRSVSCGDYFNCDASPSVYHPGDPQLGCKEYYSGGECRLYP